MKKLLHVGCLLGLILVTVLSGCGGGSGSKGPQPDAVVYAAGYYYEKGMEKPFYWTSKGAKPVSPSDGGVIYSIAYGNGQIYYGGYSKDSDPCFWTGNTLTLLGTDGEVTSMVYVNGKLYCGGKYNDNNGTYLCYWIDDDNIPNKFSANGTDHLFTIVLANGVVYGGGYYDSGNYRPCYWKGNVSRVELSEEGGNVYSSAFADGKVYLGGYHGGTPCYWTVDTTNNNFEPFNLSPSNGEVRSIICANGTVYCGGYYRDGSDNYIPCYWTGANKDPILLPIPEGIREGIVESITYANGTVYCGGYYSDGTKYYPYYWVGGAANPVLLFPDGLVNGGFVKAILVK